MAPLVLAATVWLDTTGLHASIHLNNGVVKVVPSFSRLYIHFCSRDVLESAGRVKMEYSDLN